MKQDNGKEIAILDKPKHKQKCFAVLNSDQFKKLNNDST